MHLALGQQVRQVTALLLRLRLLQPLSIWLLRVEAAAGVMMAAAAVLEVLERHQALR
jgi:hypothetical protein